MAYKIEAHIVDEGTEEIFTSVTFWGDTEEEASEIMAGTIAGWPEFAKANADGRVILDEGECSDGERPEIEEEEEEEEEEEIKT
jgi:hypothetical protein